MFDGEAAAYDAVMSGEVSSCIDLLHILHSVSTVGSYCDTLMILGEGLEMVCGLQLSGHVLCAWPAGPNIALHFLHLLVC